MAVLDQLGLNVSFFVQFLIFTVAYLVLTRFVFIPYAESLRQRELKTKGGEDLAVEIHKKAEELRTQYEAKAREVSSSVKTIFDQYRGEASQEYEKLVSNARSESQNLIESARQKVSSEIAEANTRAKAEAPLIAQEMTRQLLAK